MPTTSVIVVSHGRAEALDRCITALSQLDHPAFEIIVVADGPALSHLSNRPDYARLKTRAFDQQNISAARNIGLGLAAGEVVAFIDDDAVAEPTWLDRLIAPFHDLEVTASGGFVRGRNGVSFQWRASVSDQAGRSFPIDPGDPPPAGFVYRTEGTNMAFRRAALSAIGGFDEAFGFFLDETDVNMRLGGKTVIVPDAEVHHGFDPSPRRRRDRVPLDLSQIGASTHVFLRKHATSVEIAARLNEVRTEQRQRLLRHMQSGALEPRDVKRLMVSLEDGITDGASRPFGVSSLAQDDTAKGFFPYRTEAPGAKVVLSGTAPDKAGILEQAREAVADGLRPTVIIISRGPRYMQVRFHKDGFWLHHGGQFGKIRRTDPMLCLRSRRETIRAEIERVEPQRGLGKITK